jgi:hypothetical protein
VRIGNWYGVLAGEAISDGTNTWQPFTDRSFDFLDLDDPALASVRMELQPVPAPILQLWQIGKLIGTAAELWRIDGDPATFTKIWSGQVLRASIGNEQSLVLELGPSPAQFGAAIPRQFGPLCRYRYTSECPFALTCAKSWAACTANAQTANFGGFRWIPPAGTRLVIRETMETLG